MYMFNPKKLALFALALLLSSELNAANELDPLSASEMSLATQVAMPSARTTRVFAGAGTSASSIEMLLVERRENEKHQPGLRQADVYSYDYSRDETIHSIIDLRTNQLISTKRHQYMQLPLTENELSRATRLIFSDPEQMLRLQTEYLRITGKTLTSPDQLEVKAFTFTAETLPEGLNAASQQCGLHRCAQVLLYTHDSIVFEISPIVNLSAGLVTQNIGF